ncbi:MAG TPA: hypothetical protein VK003_06800, partial [Oceanobacillus sp.]|nr:hypothetical protein [Oceanobacillus sp.]
FEPGTLVLVRDNSVQPAPPPPPAEPQSQTLTDCTVTTQYVTLPGTPRGTLVELTATAYVDGGYQVVVNGMELWISADLVTPNGDCGG